MSDDGTPLPLIGWKERLDFPDWNLFRLRAKVDTGARTSALHVARYELETTSTNSLVHLWLDIDPHRSELLPLTLPVSRTASVRSSTGVRERRPVIMALVRLGPLLARIEMTLTNRARMRHRIILGREALVGRFVIDPGRAYLLPRPRRRNHS